jgi:hypothetical protein
MITLSCNLSISRLIEMKDITDKWKLKISKNLNRVNTIIHLPLIALQSHKFQQPREIKQTKLFIHRFENYRKLFLSILQNGMKSMVGTNCGLCVRWYFVVSFRKFVSFVSASHLAFNNCQVQNISVRQLWRELE